MEVTELMVGDWVEVIQNSEKHYAQVQMIDGYGDNATSNECICDGVYYSIDEINPVPLTEQILEKNGFVRRYSDYLWFAIVGNEYQNYICVQFRKNGTIRFVEFNFTNVINTELRMIKNVHELQHTLRLCGINKNIEL